MEDVIVSQIDNGVKNEGHHLWKEQQFDLFLHYVNKLVRTNRFPGAALMQLVLELILVCWR